MPTRQIQRVGELQFVLYSRALHPELFDIYHHDHHMVKDGYEAQIWITGVSHLIGFYHGDSAVTELIAETSAPLPRRGKLAVLPCRGEKERQVEDIAGEVAKKSKSTGLKV